MSPPPLRVCIVAEHASRCFGGEAILPYHYFRGLRNRGVDAHLFVHERTHDELVELFPDDLDRLHFAKDKWLQKLFFHVGSFLPRRVAEATLGLANQMMTQSTQRRAVRTLIHGNTVVHQPIPVSPKAPSLMYGLGCPVVCGPLNGGMDYPVVFRAGESKVTRVMVSVARILSSVANRLLPGKRRAAVVLVANARTRTALPTGLRGTMLELPENGVDLSLWSAPQTSSTPSHTSPARFIFIGRFVDWKALDIVLDAMAETSDVLLDVVGDGPMRAAWEQQVKVLGLADRVTFHGWLQQTACSTLLAEARALVLPSIFESGGAVVLEAMAMARPVIATAWGGPTDYLDAQCGFLLEPSSRMALVEGFSLTMSLLRDDLEMVNRMGSAGRSKVVTHFDWERKFDVLLEIYCGALHARGAHAPEAAASTAAA